MVVVKLVHAETYARTFEQMSVDSALAQREQDLELAIKQARLTHGTVGD